MLRSLGPHGSSALPQPPPLAARELIVVADDNADMRQYLKHLLGGRYDVHAMADGAEALEAARSLRPALVLADVMIPRLDGFALLRAIRDDVAIANTPTILLLSARAGEESRVEGLQAGADDYLVKPFTARELLARVEAHLTLASFRRVTGQREERLRMEAELERQRLQASEELLAETNRLYRELQGREAEIRALKEQLDRENLALRDEVDRTSMFEEIVGSSDALKVVLSRLSKVAPTDSTVLIVGETGTGKELIAPRRPQTIAASGTCLRQRELCRTCTDADHLGTVWPRARRLYRCDTKTSRALRAGRWRDDFPR